jgi:hypothetical protein
MKDPRTLAFRIYLPWFHTALGMRFWAVFAEIWHVDPSNFDTNTCGWSRPPLSERQLSILRHMAWCEGENGRPWFLQSQTYQPTSAADAECLLRGAIMDVSRALKSPVTFRWATEKASDLLHNSVDNCRSSFCFIPGYHSNFPEDIPSQRTEHMLQIYIMCARQILSRNRPWYRHPRWHIHHWQVRLPWAYRVFHRKKASA